MSLRAILLLAALAGGCARGDDDRAAADRPADPPPISELCPAPESKRIAAIAGAMSNDSVDTRAEPIPPTPQFRYPDELARQRIGGRALADFVVDTAGLVDLNSIAVLESTDARITEGVCLYVASSRFSPAVDAGRKVRVRRQMPFNFQLGTAR